MREFAQPIEKMVRQFRFSETEVGVTHPNTNAFIRCTDDGDVEIVAGEGLAIILHPQNKSITFVADKVKFVTKEHDGFIWNQRSMNPEATEFTEPAFVERDPSMWHGLFDTVDDFFEIETEEDGD